MGKILIIESENLGENWKKLLDDYIKTNAKVSNENFEKISIDEFNKKIDGMDKLKELKEYNMIIYPGGLLGRPAESFTGLPQILKENEVSNLWLLGCGPVSVPVNKEGKFNMTTLGGRHGRSVDEYEGRNFNFLQISGQIFFEGKNPKIQIRDSSPDSVRITQNTIDKISQAAGSSVTNKASTEKTADAVSEKNISISNWKKIKKSSFGKFFISNIKKVLRAAHVMESKKPKNLKR
jgi:hypothetical protein